MSERKTIKVNPAFFSLKPQRNKTEKKNKSRKEKIKKMSQIIRPNKAKKELLKRIKEHQKQKKEQRKKENSENIIEFTENMKDSMNYLQEVIKENKRKKQLKKTQKVDYSKQGKSKIHINPKIVGPTNEITTQPININVKPTEIHLDDLQPKDKVEIKPSLVTPNVNVNVKTPTNIIENGPKIKTWDSSQRDEPKYGCLKNGNKPTYREYVKTLKKKDVEPLNIKNSPSFSQSSNPFVERKNKLQSLIEKSTTTNHKIKNKPMGSYRRYKVRTLHKTYKLGKYKDKKRVGVLLKNNATRKKITQELSILQKTPISKVKAYLREKHLLKLGSKVPDNIARQIFTNCILSGDVINKNYNVMVHNFLQ